MDTLLKETVDATVNSRYPGMAPEGRKLIEDILIRKELEKLGDVTKIIIAQRISSVIHTDRILILDDGKIHNIGTHEQLLKEDAIYQEIYASQMKGGNSDGIENEEC